MTSPVLVILLSILIPSIQGTVPTIDMLRAKAQERMQQHLAVYSREELLELEYLYQSANRNLSGPDAKQILQRVVDQFPKSNRAGSAVLYLAQMSSGADRERHLKSAIETYGD